jgi:hypothetical protein
LLELIAGRESPDLLISTYAIVPVKHGRGVVYV